MLWYQAHAHGSLSAWRAAQVSGADEAALLERTRQLEAARERERAEKKAEAMRAKAQLGRQVSGA